MFDWKPELQPYLEKHRNRRISGIEMSRISSDTGIGRTTFLAVHMLLERAAQLVESSITANATHNLIGLALAIRAHVETCAILGAINKKLVTYYAEDTSREQLHNFLTRVVLGNREGFIFNEKEEFSPIHVLDSLRDFDRVLKARGLSEFFLQTQYEFLSELCHPNSRGTAFSSTIKAAKLIFLSSEDSYNGQADGIGPVLTLSCDLFISEFDDLLVLLREKEILPELIT